MADKPTRPAEEEREGDSFAVHVRVTRGDTAALLGRGEYDFGDRPRITPNPDGSGDLALFVTRGQIESLEKEGFAVTIESNQSARARERVSEVGEGDRFEGGRSAPKGIGRKVTGGEEPEKERPE